MKISKGWLVKPNARRFESEGCWFETRCRLHFSAHEISINVYLDHPASEIAYTHTLDVSKSTRCFRSFKMKDSKFRRRCVRVHRLRSSSTCQRVYPGLPNDDDDDGRCSATIGIPKRKRTTRLFFRQLSFFSNLNFSHVQGFFPEKKFCINLLPPGTNFFLLLLPTIFLIGL